MPIVVVVVVVVAPGRPTGFTPYPTMDSLSAFSSGRQVSGTYCTELFPHDVALHLITASYNQAATSPD